MPNTAKLVGAVMMALVGFFGATSIIPHMPDGQRVGHLWIIAVVIGAIIGWGMLGPDMTRRAGRIPGTKAMIGAGLKAACCTAVAALFTASFIVMIERSLDRRYRGPMEAIVGVFDLALDYAQLFLNVDVIATLAIGGILAAYAARGAGKAWG